MSQDVQELLQAALKLSDEDRWQLVAALMSAGDARGLGPRGDTWLEEIRRRSAEYDAGEVGPIPWAEVKSRTQLQGEAAGGDEPVGRSDPASPHPRALRPIGLAKGELVVPDDFDAPLPDDILAAFEGR